MPCGTRNKIFKNYSNNVVILHNIDQNQVYDLTSKLLLTSILVMAKWQNSVYLLFLMSSCDLLKKYDNYHNCAINNVRLFCIIQKLDPRCRENYYRVYYQCFFVFVVQNVSNSVSFSYTLIYFFLATLMNLCLYKWIFIYMHVCNTNNARQDRGYCRMSQWPLIPASSCGARWSVGICFIYDRHPNLLIG